MTRGTHFLLNKIEPWSKQQRKFKQDRTLIQAIKKIQTLSFLCLQPPASFSLALKVVLGMIFSLKEVVLGMKIERRQRCLVPVASNLKALALALSLIDLFDVSPRDFTSLQDDPWACSVLDFSVAWFESVRSLRWHLSSDWTSLLSLSLASQQNESWAFSPLGQMEVIRKEI